MRVSVSSTAQRLGLLAVLLAAFALRLQELTRQNIWWDEARNIDVALRPLWRIPTAPELDIQPPLYYWLLHGWSALFGTAVGQEAASLALTARLLSVVAGVIGVALLVPLARRVLPVGRGAGTAALIAALTGALSPFWLAESQEARMYTVGFALLAGAAPALLRYIERGGWRYPRRSGENPTSPPIDDQPTMSGPHPTYAGDGPVDRPVNRSLAATSGFHPTYALAAFVLLAAAALLTHYNAVFVLVTWFVWWAVWALLRPDRWRQLAALLGAGLGIALLVLPILPVALRQIPDYENPNITIPSVADYLAQNWRAYAGGYAFDPALLGGNGALWLWLVLGVSAVGVAAAAWSNWHVGVPTGHVGVPEPHVLVRTERRDVSPAHPLTFLLAWLLGGLALYYVAVLDRNAFNVRYASFVTPALYALIGVGLAAYGRWGRWLPSLGAGLLVLGLVPAAGADLYDARFDREHTGEVAAWLRANTGPGDAIFVDQKYPFGFYYQPYEIPALAGSAAGSEPSAPPAGADGAPLARYLFVDINTIDATLNAWAGDARRVFWLQWFESDTDPRHAVRFLLDKYGHFAGEQAFQGYVLQWWNMNPPTRFALAPNLQPLRLDFPPAAATVAVSLPAAPLHPGDPLPVAVRWARTTGEPPPKSLKARVALYDAGGARLAQADERLLNDRHRAPWQWGPDDQPLGVYLLPLPADLPAGQYTLGLLVYDADTWEALAPEGTLGTVEIEG